MPPISGSLRALRDGPAASLTATGFVRRRAPNTLYDLPDADDGDRRRRADPEAHPEVDGVDEEGLDGAHARLPDLQVAEIVQNRIGHRMGDDTDEGAHHAPERHDEAGENRSKVGGEPQGCGGDEVPCDLGEIDEGNRNQLDRLGEQRPGYGGDGHVEHAEDKADHGSRGEHAPAPGVDTLRRLRKRRGALGGHRSEGERQALIV